MLIQLIKQLIYITINEFGIVFSDHLLELFLLKTLPFTSKHFANKNVKIYLLSIEAFLEHK